MRTIRYRLVVMCVAVTVGFGIALGLHPASSTRVIAGYLVALASLGALALLRVAVDATEPRPPSEFEHALMPADMGRARPPELVRIEREITLGSASAAHLYRRLAPLLRECAATRLNARHHVDLERRPEDARRLLGDDTWAVVRPDLAEPRGGDDAGLPLRRIRSIVETLERL